jgi:hypothetical protein
MSASPERTILLDGQPVIGFITHWSTAEGYVAGFWPSYAAFDGHLSIRRGVVQITNAPAEQPLDPPPHPKESWRDLTGTPHPDAPTHDALGRLLSPQERTAWRPWTANE